MRLIGKLRRFIARKTWKARMIVWNAWTRLKFRLNREAKIPAPGKTWRKLEPIRLQRVLPEIPIRRIQIADHVPSDERSLRSNARRMIHWLQQKVLQRWLSPMNEGLPSIDEEPGKALETAYTRKYRKLFPLPELPDEYDGEPDLGRLALESPYFCYLRKDSQGGYEWDFRALGDFTHHDGLHSLGVRVEFREDKARGRLEAVRIESRLAPGSSVPGDSNWALSRKLALCAATTHMTLVRHLGWVHLVGGSGVAIATRNCLSADHPLRRLLWPHVYGTQDNLRFIIRSQISPGGDYEKTFSFTYPEMCRLLDVTHDEFDIRRFVPEEDARQRGVLRPGFETKVLNDRKALYDVMYDHALRYLGLYYNSHESLRRDGEFRSWVRELARLLPHGTRTVLGDTPTLESAAKLIAAFIYMVSVEHEADGTGLWNYQLWPHVQPVRVYWEDRRLPIDVYQRLVNANFMLNVGRASLLKDFSYLALDNDGASAMRTFRAELKALQKQMDQLPRTVWRITPRILEANINT